MLYFDVLRSPLGKHNEINYTNKCNCDWMLLWQEIFNKYLYKHVHIKILLCQLA